MRNRSKKRASHLVKALLVLFVCLSLLIPCRTLAQVALPEIRQLRPEEVVVIANRASADSMSVARYYMKRRAIPENHLFTVDFPQHRHRRAISQKVFYEKMLRPLQKFLVKQDLKNKVLALVTVYDVPYKVTDRMAQPGALKKQIQKKEEKISKLLLQAPKIHRKIPKIREEIKTLRAQLSRVNTEWERLLSNLSPAEKKRAKQVLSVEASVDSELAWLYRSDVMDDGRFPQRAYYGRSRNLYFGQKNTFRVFREKGHKNGVFEQMGLLYMTARLEGPSVEISKGLVDTAMAAEKNGPAGMGCFDATKPTLGQAKTGYDLGNYWVRRAYIETVNAGFLAKINEEKGLFKAGDCTNTLFYWGWYALSNYRDHFGGHFPPGAIAVHTASSEAKNIRKYEDGGKNPWCAGLLYQGVSFCAGPINEPFLDAFPHADIFYARLLEGWSIGEAYWAAKPYTSWMMVMIGDPLYTPFSEKNRLKHYARTGMVFQEVGQPEKTEELRAGREYRIDLFLAARTPIFRKEGPYRTTRLRTSQEKVFQVSNLSDTHFEVRSEGRLLTVSGLRLRVGEIGHLNQGEIEVRLDLGNDLGEKIVSHWVRLAP